MSDTVPTAKMAEDDKSPVKYYASMVKSFVTDTKLAADPTQDNFLKGESEYAFSDLELLLTFSGAIGVLCFLVLICSSHFQVLLGCSA